MQRIEEATERAIEVVKAKNKKIAEQAARIKFLEAELSKLTPSDPLPTVHPIRHSDR
jgi:hypothetical protein